jgi:hypothetical protein
MAQPAISPNVARPPTLKTAAWLDQRAISELDDEPQSLANITQADLTVPLESCANHVVILALGDHAAIAAADH